MISLNSRWLIRRQSHFTSNSFCKSSLLWSLLLFHLIMCFIICLLHLIFNPCIWFSFMCVCLPSQPLLHPHLESFCLFQSVSGFTLCHTCRRCTKKIKVIKDQKNKKDICLSLFSFSLLYCALIKHACFTFPKHQTHLKLSESWQRHLSACLSPTFERKCVVCSPIRTAKSSALLLSACLNKQGH